MRRFADRSRVVPAVRKFCGAFAMLALAVALGTAGWSSAQAGADDGAPAEPGAAKTADPSLDKSLEKVTDKAAEKPAAKAPGGAISAEPKQSGGEPDGVVQVANLVYAGTKSSQCFADHFLIEAEKRSSIATSRRFHAVKLSSEELYNFPLLIMTGEGTFQLTDAERKNLTRYIERGGFLLASSGCSSEEWDRSFRNEMAVLFPKQPLGDIALDHPVFHTVTDIKQLQAKHGVPRPLQGVSLGGRLGVLYSKDGLNDTSHTQGCCCCGGNEISNAVDINVNILAYALTY